MFLVYLYDKSIEPTKVMLYDEKFAILSLVRYSACNIINFCDPIDPSNTFLLIPMDAYESKSLPTFKSIKSFVPITSWVLASRDNQPGSVINGSTNYFMACHHGNTENVISLSVFSKRGDSYEVVLSDCRPMKIATNSVSQKI